MRRDCQPHFIDANGDSVGLHRVDFSDRAIGESFLQEQLHKSPSILPVEEVDNSFAPLLSLGREILSIDNLFISPGGRITIVETKLWRNPEATRKVVAQVLDYAKRLTSLSYEEFEDTCRSARQPTPLADKNLFQLVSARFPKQVKSEADFTDATQKNLRNARFLLLVVGDGIKENLENILGLLHQHPQMLFTFGLVEMQIYQSDSIRGRLIVPHLIAHTHEIVRAVVRVENHADVAISVSLPPESPDKSTTLSEQEFLDSVKEPKDRDIFIKLIAFAKEIGHLHCATRGVIARMPFHNTYPLHFFRLRIDGLIGIGRLDRQLRKRGLPDDLAWALAKDIAALFPGVELKNGTPNLSRNLKASEVADKFEDFVAIYRHAIDQIKTLTPTTAPTSDDDETNEDE